MRSSPICETEPDRVRLAGPSAPLSPKAALALYMVVYELGANAVKYGALSDDGSVEVRWTTESDRLHLVWREQGGPAVQPPSRKGLGTSLIEQGLAGEFGAEAQLDYRPEGLVCTIDAPLSRLVSPDESARCRESVIAGVGCRGRGVYRPDDQRHADRSRPRTGRPGHAAGEALDAARREPIDAAVLDVNLGEAKSFPIADVLRGRRVPFVFATGYGVEGLSEAYRDVRTLEKPFAPDQLARALNQAALKLNGSPPTDSESPSSPRG